VFSHFQGAQVPVTNEEMQIMCGMTRASLCACSIYTKKRKQPKQAGPLSVDPV